LKEILLGESKTEPNPKEENYLLYAEIYVLSLA